MKKSLLFLSTLLIYLVACTHSESEKEKKITASDSTKNKTADSFTTIDSQVNAIQKSIPSLPYVRSMKYERNDSTTFDVSVYLNGANPVSMYEEINAGKKGYKRRTIYFIDDKPSFVSTTEKKVDGKNYIFKETKSYLDNGKLVISLSRSATHTSELMNKTFEPENNDTTNYNEILKRMNRALAKSGEFDLLFSKIKKVGNRTYLVLSKPSKDSYHTNLLILPGTKDIMIKKIQANPEKFEGKKLDVKWEYQNRNGSEQLIYNGVNAKN
ncbi:hypothetical protein [Solitalea koreensis]|uniref:Uncharacterized protein n=1 Tax=Solitalea koreensis TaxID=543615 RepID=A0A521BQ77_9SPHI|nr:hypothetical protein [Solitalea koreensis]SMO49297.1 hypothetical protein SAMN06265350_102419 [Solitalea koreensis]